MQILVTSSVAIVYEIFADKIIMKNWRQLVSRRQRRRERNGTDVQFSYSDYVSRSLIIKKL